MYLFIFLTLYMFRAHRAHHQDRQIVSIQSLLAVTRVSVSVLRHPPTTFLLQSVLTQALYRQITRNSHRE